jgi:hypothetical protein
MEPLGQAGEHQQREHDGIELVLHNAADAEPLDVPLSAD